MRIGLVCPYSLDVPGGVQNHVRDLAAVLLGARPRGGVLAPGERRPTSRRTCTTAGKAVPVPFNGSVARLAFGPRAVSRYGDGCRRGLRRAARPRAAGAERVHARRLGLRGADRRDLPHGDAPVADVGRGGAVVRPSTEKITARIAVSEAARATLVQHLGGEPIVIPNGLFCDALLRAEPSPEWAAAGTRGRVPRPYRRTTQGVGRPDGGLRPCSASPPARLLVAGRGDPELQLPDRSSHIVPRPGR